MIAMNPIPLMYAGAGFDPYSGQQPMQLQQLVQSGSQQSPWLGALQGFLAGFGEKREKKQRGDLYRRFSSGLSPSQNQPPQFGPDIASGGVASHFDALTRRVTRGGYGG